MKSRSRVIDKSVLLLSYFVSISVYGFVISPVLRSGFIQDDRFDSVWGVARHGYSLGALADGIRWTDIYTQGLGRFHPLAHIVGSYSFEISERTQFKQMQFGLSLLVVVVLALLVSKWANDYTLGPVVILIISSISQFRKNFDPIVSFGIHTKILILILLVQLLAVSSLSCPKSNSRFWKVVLAASLVSGALYHEIAVVASFGIVFATRHFERRQKTYVNALVLWVISVYVLLRFRLYFTTTTSIAMPYYQLTSNPLTLVVTFLKQITGLIPLISTASWPTSHSPDLVTWTFVLTTIGLVLLLVRFRQRPGLATEIRIGSNHLRDLGGMFLWWIISSAGVVSLSVGHQLWSEWGDGYINVWLGQLGVAAIFGLWVSWQLQKSRSSRRLVFSCLFLTVSVMASFVARSNENIVDNSPIWQANTQINGWEREQSIRALRVGLLNEISQDHEIVAVPPRPWMNDAFLQSVSGDENLRLRNSWSRFGEIPDVWPSGCNQGSALSEEMYAIRRSTEFYCPPGQTRVVKSFAENFDDGFTVLATLVRFRPAMGSAEQIQMGRGTHFMLIEDARIVGSGKYSTCRGVRIQDTQGRITEVKLASHAENRTQKVMTLSSFFLETIEPTLCQR